MSDPFGDGEFNLFLTQQQGRGQKELVSLEHNYSRPKTVNLPPKPSATGEFSVDKEGRASAATPNVKSRRPAARVIPPAPSLSDHLPIPDDPRLAAMLRGFQRRYDLSSLNAGEPPHGLKPSLRSFGPTD